MSPITVLIVDDELPLRQELRSMPWHSFGAELVGEAENGEEALLLCETLNPDLVITDIIMPIMDGMELLRCVKKRFPLTQFVLLTSHGDFYYAQEAVKLGVLDYVLKLSFEEAEIQAVVEKARAIVRRENDLQSYERERVRKEISQLLIAIAAGESDHVANLPIIWGRIGGAAPFYPVKLHLELKEGDRFHLLYEISRHLEQLETGSPSSFRWYPMGDHEIVLVFGNSLSAEDTCLQAKQVMELVYRGLGQQSPDLCEGMRLMAVTGGLVKQPQDLASSLRVCTIPEAMLFYDRSLTSLTADQAAPGHIAPDDSPDADRISGIWLDAAGDKERLRKFFPESLEPWVTVNRFEPEKLKDFILRIREKAAGAHALQGKGEYDAFTNMLQAAPTLSQLVSILVKEQASEISGGRRIRSEVQLAQRLVAMRLAETITLTSIAEEVGLSSYYLSRLFREETGESFNDYVTRLRMEKAKVLLQTTQMKVYEVAESVGIPSYRYFTQLFRNWTGVAPIEYKRG